MKTTTAFAALAAGRRKDRLAAAPYIVLRIKKDGTPSSERTASDMDYCRTREEADRRATALNEMNPHSTYTVVER